MIQAALRSPGYRGTLLLALLIACGWWAIAIALRNANIFPIWFDQTFTFLQMGRHLADPYELTRMVYPPWTALIMAPFTLPPVEIATLAQLLIYFAALTTILYGYGGGRWAVLFTLLSFIALDATLELNLEWIVCLGLLVPPAWSGVFLLVKPQVALGAWIGFRRRDWLPTALVTIGCVLISLLVWGWWPPRMWAFIEVATLPHVFNIAPVKLIGVLPSFAIGLVMSVFALRRHDPVLGILGWLFFVPYISVYSLLPHLGLIMVRFRILGIIIVVATWVIYGGALLIGGR